jgi:hypothetical protein
MCKKMGTKNIPDLENKEANSFAFGKGDYVKWYLTDPHGDIVMRAGTGIVLETMPPTYLSNHKSCTSMAYKVWCTDLYEELWFSEEELGLLARLSTNPTL